MGFVFSSAEEALAGVGRFLGMSEWLVVDQRRIDAFADATGDHQWIHVDRERAKDGPFGTTIAHGCLTFSLINMFLPDLFRGEGMKMAINYGADRVRFPAPVPEGSRVRAAGEFIGAEVVEGNAVQTRVKITIEVEGKSRPACVAEILGRYYF